MLLHAPISTYSREWTTMESCVRWNEWITPSFMSYRGPRPKSITIAVNESARQYYKETGWYLISGPFPATLPQGIPYDYSTITYHAYMPADHAQSLEYFKLSVSAPLWHLYPAPGNFGRFPHLVYLYLGAFNHLNPLLCARVASDYSPKLRNIIISPLAEMPKEVRYDYSMSEKAQISSSSSSAAASHNIEDNDDYNNNGLRCFVWTMGNTRPEDPKNFKWLCSVNTCLCVKKNAARIMAKHYQHLKLLYLQFDGQHGIAFRSIRFLSNIEDYARNLRELHLHATRSTLFGQFQCTDREKQRYGSADDISHYLVQAIVHLPALEIIVLKNEDCSSLILPQEEVSSIVYMTIYDDVLESLAINCTRLKEVVIWGPHMDITASGVTKFVQETVSNQSLEKIEINCSLTDDEVASLLHRRSLLTKLKSLKVKDRYNLLCSFQ